MRQVIPRLGVARREPDRVAIVRHRLRDLTQKLRGHAQYEPGITHGRVLVQNLAARPLSAPGNRPCECRSRQTPADCSIVMVNILERFSPDGSGWSGSARPVRGQSAEELVPVAEGALAEEPHGGIPRGVVAVGHPAPVADVGQGHPDRHTQGPGKVRRGAVGRDDQVELASPPPYRRSRRAGDPGRSRGSGPTLRRVCSRPKFFCRLKSRTPGTRATGSRWASRNDRSRSLVCRVALPDHADLSLDPAERIRQVLHEPRSARGRGPRGDGFERCAKDCGQAHHGQHGRRIPAGARPRRPPRPHPGRRRAALPEARSQVTTTRPAQRLTHGRVADELDRVSQPLLGAIRMVLPLSALPSQTGCGRR